MKQCDQTVAVLGEGAFGTALACLLADCGVYVALWCHDARVAEQINKDRINATYMPTVCLVDHIRPVETVQQALDGVTYVFVTTPVPFVRSVLESARPWYKPSQVWVMLCKGIEQETLMVPTQILEDVFGERCLSAVMMGPSFAAELAAKQPTQIVVASEIPQVRDYLYELCSTPYFSTEQSDDAIGVQLCAAYKNVVALAAGMLDGVGYGDNARALLILKGLYEMASLVQAVGGQMQTAFGLAGLADLVLTAGSMQSRNRVIGKRLALGATLDDCMREKGSLPEGVNTIFSLHSLVAEGAVELPLLTAVYACIHGAPVADTLLPLLLGPCS